MQGCFSWSPTSALSSQLYPLSKHSFTPPKVWSGIALADSSRTPFSLVLSLAHHMIKHCLGTCPQGPESPPSYLLPKSPTARTGWKICERLAPSRGHRETTGGSPEFCSVQEKALQWALGPGAAHPLCPTTAPQKIFLHLCC